MIEFKNVSYAHNKGYGVNSLNMEIDEGDFTFLIGPTGSGKTTLMRLIYFDIMPDTGMVSVNGFKSTEVSKRKIPNIRKSIGMVFQDYKLLKDRNLFENVALPLHVLGFNPRQIPDRVDEALDLVGLVGKESHYPNELSGGEQQRIAISRAIANSPEIIIADEPTGNLDKKNSDNVINELLNISNINNTSLLIATHDLSVAKKMDKVYNLINGKLIEYRE